MVNPVREVVCCNNQSTRESWLNKYGQFTRVYQKKTRAPQHEIISSTSVINHICQNEDMSKSNTATAISQQHLVDRAMTGEFAPMRFSLESQEPYCHGWSGQPGGRGLWGEVWTCARVTQSGVRHWQDKHTPSHPSPSSHKHTCQQWCGNSRPPCWQTGIHVSCRQSVRQSRRPWGQKEQESKVIPCKNLRETISSH